MKKWWQKNPVRFECQPDCFKCCCKPGVVYFDRADLRHAADHLNLSPAQFKSEFITEEDGDSFVEVKDGKPCVFLTPSGCGIHESKPKQCRTYPFWKENMDSRKMWQLVAMFCPGIDKGPQVLPKTIQSLLKQFRR